jgi:hypothetical protein
MTKIKNTTEYNVAMERIEELLLVVDNNTCANDKNLVELTLLSNLVADYEEDKYPIAKPAYCQRD